LHAGTSAAGFRERVLEWVPTRGTEGSVVALCFTAGDVLHTQVLAFAAIYIYIHTHTHTHTHTHIVYWNFGAELVRYHCHNHARRFLLLVLCWLQAGFIWC